MAKLKYEFLAYYQEKHGASLRSRIFGHSSAINRLASHFAWFASLAFKNPLVRTFLDFSLGIDKRRPLPPLASQTFQKWFEKRSRSINSRSNTARRGSVVLWDDAYLSYNEPEVGHAAVRVLEAAGLEVRLIADRWCDGRPLISKGFLERARKYAAHNVSLLDPLASRGIPIIGIEPSSLAAFRDEYPDLLQSDAARRVAKQSFFIEEFISKLAERGELDLRFPKPKKPRRVLVHGHCYQKALTGTAPLLGMLRLLPDTTVEEIPSGCCGMAGAFGYEQEHYEISMAIGEDRLFPAVRSASPETIIAAAGFSCRHQIAHGTGKKALHPIEVLASGLDNARTVEGGPKR